MGNVNVIEDGPVPDAGGQYWEMVLLIWPAVADENGNVVKTGPARVEDVVNSGVVDIDGVASDWQPVN